MENFKDSHYICIYDPEKKRRIFSYLTEKGMKKYAEDNGLPGLNEAYMQRDNISDYLCIFDEKRNKWMWHYLTNKGMIKYAKEKGLYGMYKRDGERIAPEFYDTANVRRYGKTKIVHIIFSRKYNIWEGMTKKDMKKFAKKKKLSPSEMSDKYPGLYYKARKEGTLDKISKRKTRRLKDKSNDDFIEYAKKLRIYGLPIIDGIYKDLAFYKEAWRRGMVDDIFTRIKGSGKQGI